MGKLKSKPVVAIVGRPNVGKSTLFNRIIQRREAIVDDEPGITRDRKFADTSWEGCAFTLVDTGGYIPKTVNIIEKGVTRQVEFAMQEADLILFVTDRKSGITDVDHEVARLLRRSGQPVVLAVNKVDNEKMEPDAYDFVRLGLGDPALISAIGGRSVGDLLHQIVKQLGPQPDGEDTEDEAVRLAVIGRPNAGKSTFVNTILGEDRLLVTEIPGTTRDAVDVRFHYKDQDLILIDTAGLRRRSKVHESVEFYSNLRTHRVVERCDVACIFADAGEGLAQQDLRIIRDAVEGRKGVILVVNKWDLVKGDREKVREWQDDLDLRMQGLEYVPVLFISSKTGYHIKSVLGVALQVAGERKKRIGSPELNRLIEDLNKVHQPAAVRGKRVRLLYGTQVGTEPPRFVFFATYPELLKENYRRFLENRMRQKFGFDGVPLVFAFKKKKK